MKIAIPYISEGRMDKNKVPKRNLEYLEDDLLPGDIILLWRVNFDTFTNKTQFPKYFEYDYGINAEENLKKLLQNGYVEIKDSIESLKYINSKEKIEILKRKEIKGLSKLKSFELYELIKTNFSENELGKLFDIRGYKITPKGKLALEKYQGVVDKHPKKM